MIDWLIDWYGAFITIEKIKGHHEFIELYRVLSFFAVAKPMDCDAATRENERRYENSFEGGIVESRCCHSLFGHLEQSVGAGLLGCHGTFSRRTGRIAQLRAGLSTIHRQTRCEKHMWAGSGGYQRGRNPWKSVLHRNGQRCLDDQGLQRPTAWSHRSRWCWVRARYPVRFIEWLSDWLMDCLTDGSNNRIIDRLIDWSTYYLFASWLTDRVRHSPVGRYIKWFVSLESKYNSKNKQRVSVFQYFRHDCWLGRGRGGWLEIEFRSHQDGRCSVRPRRKRGSGEWIGLSLSVVSCLCTIT